MLKAYYKAGSQTAIRLRCLRSTYLFQGSQLCLLLIIIVVHWRYLGARGWFDEYFVRLGHGCLQGGSIGRPYVARRDL